MKLHGRIETDERKEELTSAMKRYAESEINIPIEWIEELKWLEENSRMSLADAISKEYIRRPIK